MKKFIKGFVPAFIVSFTFTFCSNLIARELIDRHYSKKGLLKL